MKVHLQPQKDYWDRNNHSGSHEDIEKIQEELMLLCQDRNKLINKKPTKLMLIPELMKQAGWVRVEQIEQTRLEERERCAKICDIYARDIDNTNNIASELAKHMRKK